MRTSLCATGAHPADAIPLHDKEAPGGPIPGKINNDALLDPGFQQIGVRCGWDNGHALCVVWHSLILSASSWPLIDAKQLNVDSAAGSFLGIRQLLGRYNALVGAFEEEAIKAA